MRFLFSVSLYPPPHVYGLTCCWSRDRPGRPTKTTTTPTRTGRRTRASAVAAVFYRPATSRPRSAGGAVGARWRPSARSTSGGASPSPCADKTNCNTAPCCIRCTSRAPSDRSSSSSAKFRTFFYTRTVSSLDTIHLPLLPRFFFPIKSHLLSQYFTFYISQCVIRTCTKLYQSQIRVFRVKEKLVFACIQFVRLEFFSFLVFFFVINYFKAFIFFVNRCCS